MERRPKFGGRVDSTYVKKHCSILALEANLKERGKYKNGDSVNVKLESRASFSKLSKSCDIFLRIRLFQ